MSEEPGAANRGRRAGESGGNAVGSGSGAGGGGNAEEIDSDSAGGGGAGEMPAVETEAHRKSDQSNHGSR